jgi:O-antigen ligase
MTNNLTKTQPKLSYFFFLILTFVIIGRPQDVFKFLQVIRPSLVLTLLTLILIFLDGRNPISEITKKSVGKKYLLFYLTMFFSIPFAYYRRAAFDFVIFQYSINIIYFMIIIVQVNTQDRIKNFIFILVCSVCFYGLFSLNSGVSEGGRFASGEMYDPNDLAYFFVSFLPLTALYFSEHHKIYVKILSGCIAIMLLYIIFLTGSRGGLIGLIVMFLLFFFTKISPMKRSIKIILLIGIVVFAAEKSDLIFTKRNATILNMGQDYNISDETGRIQLWKKGLDFTLRRPLNGVGAQCFPQALSENRKQRMSQDIWQPVHNSYLQISSELGLVAFTIFILMLIQTYMTLKKIRFKNSNIKNLSSMQRISGIFLICFLSHLVVAFFLTQGYSMFFTVFFAIAASLDNINNQGIIDEVVN